MKEDIIDNMVRGLVLAMLALFGLRGFLPDFVESGQLPVLLASAGVVIVGLAFRSGCQCETTCDLKLCSVMNR